MMIKKVSIPKPNNKSEKRDIYILTMLDKMILKAMHYILRDFYEKEFHANSYGYRENKKPGEALYQMIEYLRNGYQFIVSIDIEKCFDNINHRLLLGMIRNKITDKRIIILIERYLKQKIKFDGYNKIHTKGVVQGSPLSPLLANIYLNEFDWYMSKNGIVFKYK